jgi:hypothetical protein
MPRLSKDRRFSPTAFFHASLPSESLLRIHNDRGLGASPRSSDERILPPGRRRLAATSRLLELPDLLLVGGDGIPVKECLSHPVTDWLLS